MDRHGKLLGKKMQGTHGATTNHIPARGPALSVYGLAEPSCQAMCILTDADCHSSEGGFEHCVQAAYDHCYACDKAALPFAEAYVITTAPVCLRGDTQGVI